ncbi:PA1414 family protein [Metapseudomonas furukawaii]|nr:MULTISPECIES: PA1414 family protein [Pseudomonas]
MKKRLEAWMWQLAVALGLMEAPRLQPIPVRNEGQRQRRQRQ